MTIENESVSSDQSKTDSQLPSFYKTLHVPKLVGNLFTPLLVLSLVFLAAAITIVILFLWPEQVRFILYLQFGLLVAGLLIILMMMRRVYREVLKPMDALQSWVSRIHQGDFSAEAIQARILIK